MPGGLIMWLRSGVAGVILAAIFSSAVMAEPPRNCPVRPVKSAATRVIGGAKPDLRNWQGMVTLRETSRSSSETVSIYQCGGVLIAPQWVATAAHCVATGPAESDLKFSKDAQGDWLAFAGGGRLEVIPAVERLDVELAKLPKYAVVERIVVHPDFDSSVFAKPSYRGDIALLKLREPLASPTMRISGSAAADPMLENPPLLWVAGNGLTDASKSDGVSAKIGSETVYAGSMSLLEALVPPFNFGECKSKVSAALAKEDQSRTYAFEEAAQICAGGPQSQNKPKRRIRAWAILAARWFEPARMVARC